VTHADLDSKKLATVAWTLLVGVDSPEALRVGVPVRVWYLKVLAWKMAQILLYVSSRSTKSGSLMGLAEIWIGPSLQ
jgi:hypothetical protein